MTPRQAKRAEWAASKARIEAAQSATRAVVKAGVCPDCGSAIKRNLALTGWYQCVQFGAIGWRLDANKPQCNWQGFTE
jgi:hypothetical protein